MWFQQDGATCHTGREKINLLNKIFDEQLILLNGPINWPPWSYDLSTPIPQKQLEHLEVRTRRIIVEILPDLLLRECEN